MKLVGIMPVRNEDWILGLSARVSLMWCDELVILDHCSFDGTRDIIHGLMDEFDNRVGYLSVVTNTWDEMRHRQMMLDSARELKATHIAIIDADEVLTGNLLTGIKSVIETLPNGKILQLPGYNLRCGLDRYHANGLWGKRWFSTVFRDDPKLGWHGDQFHHREPFGIPLVPENFYRPIPQDNSGVMHLWGASERRLKAKHALYKITERIRFPARPVKEIDWDYSRAIHTSEDWAYKPVPAHWWAPYAHLRQYLDVDAEPWQEQACRDAVAKHGREIFKGLDLFGVV